MIAWKILFISKFIFHHQFSVNNSDWWNINSITLCIRTENSSVVLGYPRQIFFVMDCCDKLQLMILRLKFKFSDNIE